MRNIPHYVPVWYKNNPETGYYTKTPEQPQKEVFNTMPYELRVEKTQAENIKQNAKRIIRSREKTSNDKYKFFTGIKEIYDTNCFVGDHLKVTRKGQDKSLVIFCFSHDNSYLRCFYFPGFCKFSSDENLLLATKILPYLLNQHI